MPLPITRGAASAKAFGFTNATGGAANIGALMASLPQKSAQSNLSGTVTVAQFASIGLTISNNMVYTTIGCYNSSQKFNALMINQQDGTQTSYGTPRLEAGPINLGAMQPLKTSTSRSSYSPMSWVGYTDASSLVYANYATVRCVMGAIGPLNDAGTAGTEVYFQRPIGTNTPSDQSLWSDITTNEGSNWSQNVTTQTLLDAINATNYTTAKTNGPWSSGHFGAWGWNTNNGYPSNNSCLRYWLYGQGADPTTDGIFIFERNDTLMYPPSRTTTLILFWPDYPAL